MLEKLKNHENTPVYLALLIGFLAGTVLGFLISPIQKGITIGSHNQITSNEFAEDKEEE